MVLKHFFLTLILGSLIEFAFGQIQLKNPSFENGYHDCSTGHPPVSWQFCEIGVANCRLNTLTNIHPYNAVIDGDYIAGIRTDFLWSNGSFAQQLNCDLDPAFTYSFSFWMSGYSNDDFPDFFSKGIGALWLGIDSCDTSQLVFQSERLDTIWQQRIIYFTPNQTYNYIQFRGHPIDSIHANILIDALSPIYVVNAHQIHTYQQDTVLPIGSAVCINLNAYADAGYDSIWWEQQGVGVISHQINAGVHCVDSNTTFIVHSTGSDSTCAGYLPSSDTIRVKFYDPNNVNEINNTLIAIYPNPANSQLFIESNAAYITEINIYNTTGSLVSQTKQPQSKSVDISQLATGVYVAEIKVGDVSVKRRWVKI